MSEASPLDAEYSEPMPQDHALWMLTKYAEEAREVARMTAEWVQKARDAGASWQQIGDALEVSKQAAQQRYGKTD